MTPTLPAGFRLRQLPEPSDPARVRALVDSLAMFTAEEVDVAEELVLERLQRGPASGYEFVLLDQESGADGWRLAGYACYGRIPCTVASYDLYWIAVDKALQGHGLGRLLLDLTEYLVRAAGGERLLAETSSLPRYAPTRKFYLGTGFFERARFPDFYARGDDKLVYEKGL